MLCQGTGLIEHTGERLESSRTTKPDIHPKQSAAKHQRMGNVVAISDESERLACQITMNLLHGEEIGQRLAGMFEIRQGIDHRNRGPMGVVGDLLLGEGANRKSVAVATENPCGVFQRLAAAQLGDAGIEINGLASKPGHRHLKTHPRARRSLAEDQTQHAVAEIDPPIATFQLGSQLKNSCCLLGIEVS